MHPERVAAYFELPKGEREEAWNSYSEGSRYAILTEALERHRDDPRKVAAILERTDPIVRSLAFAIDPLWDFHNCLKIRRDDATLVPFIPNTIQVGLIEKWVRAKRDKKPIRWLVPKARKEGVSTLVAGLFYHDTARREGRNTTIVGYCVENTAILRDMYDRMLKRDHACLRPTIEQHNTERIKLSSPSGIIRTWTAANLEAGRGDTIHNLHGSEVAFWGDGGDKTALSLLNAVPETTWDTAIVWESTGNGDAGVFYEYCMDAAADRNDWTLLFLPWNDFPAYMRPFEDPRDKERLLKSLDGEEKHIQKLYSLTPEQLNWRRYQIRNKMPGRDERAKRRRFKQEFPISLDECFQASVAGRAFDEDICQNLLRRAPKRTIFSGDVRTTQSPSDALYITGTPRLVRAPQGPLRLFTLGRKIRKGEGHFKDSRPRKGGQYALGADCAEGTTSGDYSAVVVLDRDRLVIAAYWMGKLPPGQFSESVRNLMAYFNDGYGGVEINSQGIAVIERLKETDRYPFLYHQRDIARPGSAPGRRIGWRTTAQSKPRLIALIHEFLANHGAKARIPWEIMRQLANYIETPAKTGSGKMKWKAGKGHHDDLVMALGIALVTHKECPYTVPEDKPKEEASDLDRWNIPDGKGERIEDDILGTNY